MKLLDDFEGFLQADAFSGYDCIYAGGRVLEVACWAHARRKFFDAQGSNSTASKEMLDLIWKLFELERRIADSSPEQRVERQAEAKPILASIKAFLNKQKLIALPA